MSDPVRGRPDRTAMLLAALGFLTLGVMTFVQIIITSRTGNRSRFLGSQLVGGVTTWIGWAVVAPAIITLTRRFNFGKGRRFRSLVAHLAGLVVCHVFMATLMVAGLRIFGLPGPAGSAWNLMLEIATTSRISASILTYVAIAGLAVAIRTLTALRARELEASRLGAQAVRARLEVLAARLQPHFLFNSLHAVGALVDEDPARARAMLAELGDLLREVLRDGDGVEISLAREMELLNRYLGIEQIRFADRLRVEIRIAPEALELQVPRFLLQPLVENALRHGLNRRSEAGTLRIDAAPRDGKLRLSVWNDGPPLPEPLTEGFGVSATRERLRTRYGATASLALRSSDGGVLAMVEVPMVLSSLESGVS